MDIESGGTDCSGAEESTDRTEGSAPTNGVETYYVRRGEGPPVVFVLGMATDHRMWDAQATALADAFTTTGNQRRRGRSGSGRGTRVERRQPVVVVTDRVRAFAERVTTVEN